MSKVQKYKSKPVVIEASQINTEDYDGLIDIITWINEMGGQARAIDWDGYVIAITTLEGEMNASDGDYIIKGLIGEFYPCKPEVFEAKYEIIESVPDEG